MVVNRTSAPSAWSSRLIRPVPRPRLGPRTAPDPVTRGLNATSTFELPTTLSIRDAVPIYLTWRAET